MRTIEIGAWTPPSGATPGIRRPVRTITLPPISSRRIRFGEPTSPRPSGRDRRRLEPEPVLADRGRGLVHDAVVGLAAPLEREIEARELELDPDHVGLEHAEALLQQLLSRLVALEDDDRPLVAHRPADASGVQNDPYGRDSPCRRTPRKYTVRSRAALRR